MAVMALPNVERVCSTGFLESSGYPPGRSPEAFSRVGSARPTELVLAHFALHRRRKYIARTVVRVECKVEVVLVTAPKRAGEGFGPAA